jgi:cytochrome c-type biogenesis protein CcmE
VTPRRQRMLLIGLVVAGVTLSAGLALRAFQENLRYFFSPSQVAAGEAPDERLFRLGGMVVEDSVAGSPAA